MLGILACWWTPVCHHECCGLLPRRHWTKRAAVSWLLNTQLCPVIWALILGLLAVLVYKVTILLTCF